MKKRKGFVPNSSSSSFVIQKKDITPLQAILIHHHDQVGWWMNMGSTSEPWAIREDPMVISGYVPMDNFDMDAFLQLIGVDPDVVVWDRDRW